MMPPPIPQDEPLRLRVIERFGLVDALPDRFLDVLTFTIARTFSVPTCAVSIIDANRQVFRSRFGLALSETPRDCSMCAHMLWAPTPLVVNDTTKDPRFADNPLVTGEPYIRFYAGVPISLRGVCLGALCIIDHRVRSSFGPNELRLLVGAATAVEERLIAMSREGGAEAA